jgi:transcriptional regulator with XRE-family HTH domain
MTVRSLRGRLGLSQEALADAAGIHRTYLGDVEQGKASIGFLKLLGVAAALEVEPAQLVFEFQRMRDGQAPEASRSADRRTVQ